MLTVAVLKIRLSKKKVIKEPKRNKIFDLFYRIIGWPQIDVEHSKAVEAIKRFMFFGKILLVYQPHPNAVHPIAPTRWFTYLSLTIDLCTLITVIRLIFCFFTDNLLTLAYMGDIFVGIRNAYALRMLSVCAIACLGAFRAISCYLARNGSLDWTKVIDKAMINGWKPEVLNMKELYCLKWRQISVFITRQVVGASLVIASVWLTCYVYLTVNCKTVYMALQNPTILGFFAFWQVIALIAMIWLVPQAAWIGVLYVIVTSYVLNKSNSVYSDLQTSLKWRYIPSLVLRKLCNQNILFLNEFDSINRFTRYISYAAYNLISVVGQVAIFYSYLGLFGMPLADRGLGLIGFNTIFQIGFSSYLAAKSVAKIGLSYSHYHRIYQNNINIEPRLKLKLLGNLDRLSSPFVGFWVGESFAMDNYSFIQYVFETGSNMMLIIVTMSNLIWKN
uniref:Gustatory receptor n=1 Tax=Tetranychus urticae TaxID=32264 RepID=T1K0T0_TETUR